MKVKSSRLESWPGRSGPGQDSIVVAIARGTSPCYASVKPSCRFDRGRARGGSATRRRGEGLAGRDGNPASSSLLLTRFLAPLGKKNGTATGERGEDRRPAKMGCQRHPRCRYRRHGSRRRRSWAIVVRTAVVVSAAGFVLSSRGGGGRAGGGCRVASRVVGRGSRIGDPLVSG